MVEHHEWEWLKRDDLPPAKKETETGDRQIDDLRRWVDTTASNSPKSEDYPRDRSLDRHRERIRQRIESAKTWLQNNRSSNRNAQTSSHRVQPISAVTSSTPEPPSISVPVKLTVGATNPSLPVSSVSASAPAVIGSLPSTAIDEKQPSEQKLVKQSSQKPMAPKKDDYREGLKQEFTNLFETLDLKDTQKHYLRSRWLDQVLWMEGRAGKARDFHYRLRLTTIIGGVLIPALVSLNFMDANNERLKQFLGVSTFALSQIVAVSAATEQFFNYGERWRHYRRGVESLKTQGWQFFELGGPYQTYKTHDEAFHIFAGQVEAILQQDVEVYATQVTQPKKDSEPKENSNSVAITNTPISSEVSNRREPAAMNTPSLE